MDSQASCRKGSVGKRAASTRSKYLFRVTLLENLDIGALRGVFRCYMRRLGNHRPIRFSYYGFEVAELKGHSREAMIICDLCGQAKECRPKEIEGKEYDICSECWTPLAEKLKAKGRAKKSRETVF